MSESDENEEFTPNDSQAEIIESDNYPMRVLAGAGTGKTTTMVWKIEDLVENGVPPDEILALTFTNKAATAMQEKVADQLDDPERAYDITATTYHAIAHELLTEHSYYADLDPSYEIADEVERSKLVYECLDEIPYQFTDPRVTEPDDTSFITDAEDRLERFISQFKSAKISPSELAGYLPPAEALGVVGEFVSSLHKVADESLHVHGNTTPNSLDSDQLASSKNGLQTLLAEAKTCQEVLPDSDGGQVLTDLIEDVITILSQFQDYITSLEVDDVTQKDLDYIRAPAYLLGQHDDPPGNLPEQDTRLITRFEELVRDWQRASDLVEGYRAYEQRLTERELLDYDDLISETLALFEHETLGPRLRQRYQYIVCDEFQDTDKAQFTLVQELVGDDNLFLVGDDDQAIYEWRGANPRNIRKDIIDLYPGLHTEELEHNYRSRPDILELANEMVAGIETRSTAKELDPDRIPQDGAAIATLTDYKKDREIQRIGAAMEQLVNGTAPDVTLDIDYGDMAVLLRDNHHARDLLPMLEQREIPYELAGDLASSSMGVTTLIAYLKILADPEKVVPMNRLLLLRYRLSESDLDRLHNYDGTVIEALQAVPAEDLTAPDRARTAADHLTELLSRRETHSMSRLYTAIKQVTDIELFLTADEREKLQYVDRVVEQFDDSPIETPLNEDFIEHLRHSASGLIEDGTDGADPSTDAVTLLTVHKAKGLEFPVVFMPHVTEDTWGPSVRSGDRLRAKLEDDTVTPATREEQEQRRVFHVGVTRAEDLLVLSTTSSNRSNSDPTADLVFEWGDIYDALPATSDLHTPDAAFPVWEEVTKALPDNSVDLTEVTDAAVSDTDQATNENQTTTDANEIIDWIHKILAGDVGDGNDADVTALDLPSNALTEPVSPEALRKHSYSAIDRFETCHRWHYLSNVVYAFTDPASNIDNATEVSNHTVTDRNTSQMRDDGVSAQLAGTIFHETAEQAAVDPDCNTPAAWERVAANVAAKHGVPQVPARVSTCIANYHESSLADWDVVATERQFELNLGTHPEEDRPLIVRGYIDAIYKHKGSYYVVDYKTNNKYSADHRRQVKIYMLACEDLFDYNVSAGHVYYLNQGPNNVKKVEPHGGFATLRDQVRDALIPLNNSSYTEPTAEEPLDCKHCPHNNLPCSLWPPENAD